MSKGKRKRLVGLLIAYCQGVALCVIGSIFAANAASFSSFDFVFGLLATVTGVLLIGVLVIRLPREFPQSKLLAVVISSVASLAVIGIVILPWATNYRDYIRHKSYLDVAHSACTGLGVDWVATYTDDRGFHPAVIADRNIFGYRRWSHYNYGLPVHWQPELAGDIQLVVCIDRSEQDMIEYCDYHDPRGPRSVSRRQHVLTMRLVNARTGANLQMIEMRGDPPEECPPAIRVPPGETLNYNGDPVSTSAVIGWLRGYVEP